MGQLVTLHKEARKEKEDITFKLKKSHKFPENKRQKSIPRILGSVSKVKSDL